MSLAGKVHTADAAALDLHNAACPALALCTIGPDTTGTHLGDRVSPRSRVATLRLTPTVPSPGQVRLTLESELRRLPAGGGRQVRGIVNASRWRTRRPRPRARPPDKIAAGRRLRCWVVPGGRSACSRRCAHRWRTRRCPHLTRACARSSRDHIVGADRHDPPELPRPRQPRQPPRPQPRQSKV